MKDANQGSTDPKDGRGLHIAIVQTRYNADVTHALLCACLDELRELGVAANCITHITVPGALEAPIALQALARQQTYDALIALGCVIRGETYHFELVANESAAGISRVALDNHTPIANAILTTDNLEQACARQVEKGRDAARVAVEMAVLVNKLTIL
jgi:6,7-dimethyl-8-ribityllumazine synthase